MVRVKSSTSPAESTQLVDSASCSPIVCMFDFVSVDACLMFLLAFAFILLTFCGSGQGRCTLPSFWRLLGPCLYSNVAPNLRQNGDQIKTDLRLAAAACVCLIFLMCLSYLWAPVGSYGSVFRGIIEWF